MSSDSWPPPPPDSSPPPPPGSWPPAAPPSTYEPAGFLPPPPRSASGGFPPPNPPGSGSRAGVVAAIGGVVVIVVIVGGVFALSRRPVTPAGASNEVAVEAAETATTVLEATTTTEAATATTPFIGLGDGRVEMPGIVLYGELPRKLTPDEHMRRYGTILRDDPTDDVVVQEAASVPIPKGIDVTALGRASGIDDIWLWARIDAYPLRIPTVEASIAGYEDGTCFIDALVDDDDVVVEVVPCDGIRQFEILFTDTFDGDYATVDERDDVVWDRCIDSFLLAYGYRITDTAALELEPVVLSDRFDLDDREASCLVSAVDYGYWAPADLD